MGIDFVSHAAIVGTATVTIFGGGYFVAALTYFTVQSIAQKIARKRRAQRILRAEAQRWNDTH